MLTREEALEILRNADLLCSEEHIGKIILRMADEITEKLAAQNPLVLCVMKGGVVFAGQLLPRLGFPLDFECIQVSRYHNKTRGGEMNWVLFPAQDELKGRVVLVVDDILDEGITLAGIRQKVLESGATAFYSATLVDKNIGKTKSFQADFVGLELPNRYVFGFGMDVHGAWRNLPAIYAVASEWENK